jgi:hypothetical protein
VIRRAGGDGFRLLDTRQAGDIALLHRLLETRQAVSQVVGVVNEKAVFCFNESSRPLHYVADLDVIVCLELEERRLKLFDIVGPKIPPLASVLERIPQPLDEVAICFSADQLAVEGEATPYVLDHDGPSYLMVRGPARQKASPLRCRVRRALKETRNVLRSSTAFSRILKASSLSPSAA